MTTASNNTNISAPSGFVQDGADFYNAATNQLICSYPDMVANDYDVGGAEAAATRFQSEYPEYVRVDL
jgi:hypothetical protein